MAQKWFELFCFQDYDLLKTYLSKIQDLEGELFRLKNLSSKGSRLVDCIDSDDDNFRPKGALFPCNNEYSSDYDSKAGDLSGKLWQIF